MTPNGPLAMAVTEPLGVTGRLYLSGAAIGVQMSLDLLEKRFWAIAKQPSDTDCSNIEGVCPLSCESVDLNCFLVDNNGFILLSKDRNEESNLWCLCYSWVSVTVRLPAVQQQQLDLLRPDEA
ncbi:voltage-dependent calcium channel subunit alpha-2/delta-4-like protein [Lates japonicus]|uniref:Voltage-dependent calcium channel subunit alpha-2/delta-4-like protein n=1 Tax=Lates japonicus TaxID=270547 RepID=A0AAD3RMR8_LATJO|nr:voltage-dependent calcium channel subunit alpha-2/delta-4-like protein [Lates japonicus]